MNSYNQSEQMNELVTALAKFHIEFQTAGLKKDAKNEHLKNKYVTLDNILNTIRPILAKNGLVIVQALAGEYLTTTLYHTSGQYIQTSMIFSPMSGNKGTNAMQELGGGITYARRYSISAMLSISVDADDDAVSAGRIKETHLQKQTPKKKVKTDEELQKIVSWLIQNPDRHSDIDRNYELTAEQKQFITDNI